MQNVDQYATPPSPSLFHMLISEEDFILGAKTTPFLPPAILSPHHTDNSNYDLPEWMEGRGALELPELADDLTPSFHASAPLKPTLPSHLQDNHPPSIKAEDMLVPLCKLQPPTPPASPPSAATQPVIFTSIASNHITPLPVPTPPNPPLPKIIICRKVTAPSVKTRPIQVHYQIQNVKHAMQVIPASTITYPVLLHPTPHTLDETPADLVVLGEAHSELQENSTPLVPAGAMTQEEAHEDIQEYNTPLVKHDETAVEIPYDAEELIKEMVEMIGNSEMSGSTNTSSLQQYENMTFDPLAIDTSIDDLFSELDSSDFIHTQNSESSSSSSFSLPPSVPTPQPSPVPSHASLSVPLESPSVPTSPNPSDSLSLLSPVPSSGSLSPMQSNSESFFSEESSEAETECPMGEWSPLEETHSYSRSQRKAKSARRSQGARKTPYPVQDRKERKKEQNKQAALRYRQKKKQEEEELLDKIEAEEERQRELKSKYSSIKQELTYLKKIMREVFMAKGLLSEESLKKAAKETRMSKKQK